MAKLVDHRRKTTTPGSIENLVALMVTAQMGASRFKCADRERYAVAVVKSAIRRNGRTDAQQQLVMSGDDRERWEAANPIPS